MLGKIIALLCKPFAGRANSSGSSDAGDGVHIDIDLGDGFCRIDFPGEGLTTSARVARLSGRYFRLESFPIFSEAAAFGDVIEADVIEADLIRFVRVVVPSGRRVHSFLLSRSPECQERAELATAKAEALGGYVERVLGGLLLISLPAEQTWDPTPEIIDQDQRSGIGTDKRI